MKRIFFAGTIFVMLASLAFGASSVAWTVYETRSGDVDLLQVVAAVTAHTDGTVTTVRFQQSDGRPLDLAGYYLFNVAIVPGGTAPTDDSDLTLPEHSSTGYDLLQGKGANDIDSATTNYINLTMPVFGPLYLAVANNSVNGATFTCVFRFVK